jgi:hypothetical protein
MSLDPLRQIIFDVLCHCFGGLLAHCESFEQVVTTQNWSLVRLAQECFDPAANKFGSTFKEDPSKALTDLLDLMAHEVGRQRPKNRDLIAAYDTYRETVRESLLVPFDLSEPQTVG